MVTVKCLGPAVTREYVNLLDEEFRMLKHMNGTSSHDGVQLSGTTG
jgi:hypothetical protein